ncbi:MAG: hypothetical protein JXK94_07820 [Deltaproteobacteria bacterium]|nr:hypothetical protein [Deltaproteobacteria bacterium]
MNYYYHQQFGKTLVSILGGGAIFCLLMMVMLSSQASITLLLVSALLLVGAILFSSLTIAVDGTHLRWSFGPGLIHNQVPLDTIVDVAVTTTSLLEGWGIHLTRRGWHYSVSGNQAVVIRLKTGKRFLLGSDEPEKLASILQEHIPEEKKSFPDFEEGTPQG